METIKLGNTTSRLAHRPRDLSRASDRGEPAMTRKTILLGLGIAAALAAGIASGDDLGSRAVRERQQHSDAFDLQLQQSLQSSRGGNLGPGQQAELYSRQLGQRQQQDELFYRQQVQANSPSTDAGRRAEALRDEQERQQQLSRFRSDPAAPGPIAGRPAPLADPTVVRGSVARAPAEAMDAAVASPGADLSRPGALAAVRRIESAADVLWQAALRRDWSAAQIALDYARQSVNALRSDRFKAEHADRGGDAESLAAGLDRLDAAIVGVEVPLDARDAAAVMHGADELQMAAGDLTVY